MQMQVTLEHTKRASVLLIRKLFLLMQNLGSLPSSVYLTMKLYYFDDCKKRSSINVCFKWHIDTAQCFILVTVTPEEYEPPGFKEGECDSLWFEGTAVHFKVGKD